ncbi:MAG: hypothetical protein AAGU23_06020 [Bacillota bacterium]
MQVLLNHWHCILPVIGLGAAFFLMREKTAKKKEQPDHTVQPQRRDE